jgi:hypothetical protein
MTTFILSPAARTAADQVVADPKAMLDAGLLVAYSERANGTTRHLELAPVGSTRRDTAEWISERLDEGATVKQVARELHASVPTVRRLLMSLELTEEIEAGEWDDVWADAQGFALKTSEDEDEDQAAGCTCSSWLVGEGWHTATCPLSPATDDAAPVVLATVVL